MKQKYVSPVFSIVLSISMLGMNTLPVLALGELPIETPTPDLSTPTPIATPAMTAIPTPVPDITTPAPIPISTAIPTPLPSISPSDTTPPVISDVLESSLLSTDATIVWATDELAISTLEYSTTTGHGSSATLPATALLVHAAIILNLSPATTYHYCIHATDLSGNTSNSCNHSFTTAASDIIIDANPPTISDVSITSLTSSTVTVNWTTEEVANGEIEYGTTPSYGSSTPFEPALSLSHSTVLFGLTPNTLYHYRITSSDEVGNTVTSPDNTFTTEVGLGASAGSGSVNASAVISSIETAEITFNSVTIAWQTDLPSDSQVEYGDSSLFGQSTTLNSTLSTFHSVKITNLSPHTNYYFRVKSKPVGVSVVTVSSNHDFNTLFEPAPVVVAANITAVSSVPANSTSTTISATTDLATTVQVQYGVTTEYGQTDTDGVSATNHSILLNNLFPDTVYQYRVKATDTEGNIIYSENYSFTTGVSVTPIPTPSASPTPSVNSTPLISPETINNLSVSARDKNAATLTWHTASDESDAVFWYDIRYSTSPITENNFNNALEDQMTLLPQADLDAQGTSRSYIVAGLTPGVTYYFALKLKSEQNTYSPLSNVISITLPSTSSQTNSQSSQTSQSSSGQTSSSSGGSGSVSSAGNSVNAPTMLNVEGVDKEIVFSWKNPNESSFVRTVLVKKEGGYPTSPQDGRIIHEGDAETFTDTNLSNGKTYYYAIYSYNDAKQYSRGTQVSPAPRQGMKEEIIYKNPDLKFITLSIHFVKILKRGDKDIEVEHLQEILARDEGLYPEKLITGYFGTLTEQAVKKFQKRHNLPQTGITDIATQQKLNIVSRSSVKLEMPEDMIIFNRDLSRGNQGDDVVALQKFLVYEGSYTTAIVDGIYGPATVQAVKLFQKKYGIKPVSGYYGPKTRHRLKEITGL